MTAGDSARAPGGGGRGRLTRYGARTKMDRMQGERMRIAKRGHAASPPVDRVRAWTGYV
ncbi:hypothetical protein [Leucobacter chromiiresistens]|uniref:Uncharacterized protein n=1 Tax=Leucobacter chromiiresistens TaxID=1079994 RepID=A0A1H0ZK13_9MICO|nr:hypothetical protein [Leucobacter chromiiresistens]SDQ27793.1 hypothetical protein SAMN04488565_1835 [Leucobacter chromiiresistens]